VALAVSTTIFSNPTIAAPADQIVSGLMEKRSAGFNKQDADALASLYSKDALFFGSTPTLHKSKEGVATYFNALPRWKSPMVQFTDLVVNPIGSENAPPVSYRLTWVVIREDNDWKIVNHHASPKAAPH
jgi:ketosteroid isomerase-like protein